MLHRNPGCTNWYDCILKRIQKYKKSHKFERLGTWQGKGRAESKRVCHDTCRKSIEKNYFFFEYPKSNVLAKPLRAQLRNITSCTFDSVPYGRIRGANLESADAWNIRNAETSHCIIMCICSIFDRIHGTFSLTATLCIHHSGAYTQGKHRLNISAPKVSSSFLQLILHKSPLSQKSCIWNISVLHKLSSLQHASTSREYGARWL